jgi:hypothetical protein
MSKPQDANNIIAALKQHDRVCEIDINGWIDDISNSALKKICAMEMGDPFSALTYLRLLSNNEDVPVLPDSFLGGSAPRLQTIHLSGIPFAALPKLLLSTRDLVSLFVRIPTLSRCLSPTAMVTCLSALTRLENLSFGFRFPRSRAVRENQLLPRMSRVVFPALATLIVKGDSEYFEDFIAQIDTPLLDVFYIKFFNQLIFDTPRLHDFITRTEAFKSPHKASIVFSNFNVVVQLFRRDGSPMDEHRILWLDLPCRPSDWQLSSIVQVCRSALPPLPTLECLEIISYREHHDVEDTQLLEVLHLFTSVKNLVLSEILSLPVAAAMGKISGATEVLPALQNLFLQVPQSSKLIEQAIGKYIAARQLSGFPVTVYNWGSESEKYVHWDVGDR